MTVIFFDGPDGSKKTTIAASISIMTSIPMWERGDYLPHHHSKTEKDGDIDFHRDPDAIWYIIDEMRTIEAFKKMKGHIIVDRNPKVSECVYRRLEGKPSKLEYDKKPSKDEVVVLLYDSSKAEDQHQSVFLTYKEVLNLFGIDYIVVDTKDPVPALEKINETIYQWIPRIW